MSRLRPEETLALEVGQRKYWTEVRKGHEGDVCERRKLPPLAQLMSCEMRRLGKSTEVIPWLWWPRSSDAGRLPSLQKQQGLSQNAEEIKFRGEIGRKTTLKKKEKKNPLTASQTCRLNPAK